MDDQPHRIELSVIHEHDFRSPIPLIGPLIQVVRSAVYQLTAKWGVLSVIHQQNQINQDVVRYLREHEERLCEYDARIIEQDRDLAYLSRAIAELEIRQRHLVELVRSQSDAAPQPPTVPPFVE